LAGSPDPRLTEFAGLAEEFYSALTEENELPARLSDEDRAPFEQRTWAAEDAIDALVDRLDPSSSVDLGIRAKVAEWRYHRREDDLEQDNWIKDLIRSNLAVAGIPATEKNPFWTNRDCPSETPKQCPVYKPDSVTAGEDIAEMRRLSQRYIDAITFEGGAADYTRCFGELVAFGKTVLAKIGKGYSQRDDFVVWANLVLAYDDIYLAELEEESVFGGSIDHNRNHVLKLMFERARETGDQLIVTAQRWNAQQGGANV
jgi:hypothetical protein